MRRRPPGSSSDQGRTDLVYAPGGNRTFEKDPKKLTGTGVSSPIDAGHP